VVRALPRQGRGLTCFLHKSLRSFQKLKKNAHTKEDEVVAEKSEHCPWTAISKESGLDNTPYLFRGSVRARKGRPRYGPGGKKSESVGSSSGTLGRVTKNQLPLNVKRSTPLKYQAKGA